MKTIINKISILCCIGLVCCTTCGILYSYATEAETQIETSSPFQKGSGDDATTEMQTESFQFGFGYDVISEDEEIKNTNTEQVGAYPGTEIPFAQEELEILIAEMETPDFESVTAIGELYYGMNDIDVDTILHLVQITRPSEKENKANDCYYQYLCASSLINRYVLNSYPHHYSASMIADFYDDDVKYNDPSVISTIMGIPVSETTYEAVLLALTHPFPGVYYCHGKTPENNYKKDYQSLDDALYVSTVWNGWGIWEANAKWY